MERTTVTISGFTVVDRNHSSTFPIYVAVLVVMINLSIVLVHIFVLFFTSPINNTRLKYIAQSPLSMRNIWNTYPRPKRIKEVLHFHDQERKDC